MKKRLAKSAESVQFALNCADIDCKVLELPSSTRTAADAATSIGCSVSQITKSLIFKTKLSSKPVLVLASGSNKVDEDLVEQYTGEAITKAEPNFVREITGFAIGGIPPIGHSQKINLIFIDQDLLKHEVVWAAAGTPNAVFCINCQDLLHITDAKVISIMKSKRGSDD